MQASSKGRPGGLISAASLHLAVSTHLKPPSGSTTPAACQTGPTPFPRPHLNNPITFSTSLRDRPLPWSPDFAVQRRVPALRDSPHFASPSLTAVARTMEAPDPHLQDEPHGSGDQHAHDDTPEKPRPRQLPDDLPTSLDDRRSVPVFSPETEMYDAWQGT